MSKSFVQFLSIQYNFSVDRQLDTSGHVLKEVGLCERLSEDLVTTPSLGAIQVLRNAIFLEIGPPPTHPRWPELAISVRLTYNPPTCRYQCTPMMLIRQPSRHHSACMSIVG